MNLRGVFSFLALCSVDAWAKPILWTLQGFTFSDGGTAFGSFIYDADTSTYSNFNIITTTGSARGGTLYTVFNSNLSFSAYGFFAATTSLTPGSPGVIFGFEGLTNAGGTISKPFVLFNEGPYNSSLNGLLGDSTYRQSDNGQLIGAPVPPQPASTPLPPSIILSLAGLTSAGLYMARRKFLRKQSLPF